MAGCVVDWLGAGVVLEVADLIRESCQSNIAAAVVGGSDSAVVCLLLCQHNPNTH